MTASYLLPMLQASTRARIVKNAKQFIPDTVSTVVGTGVSGALSAGIIGAALKLRVVIVRKEQDTSNHSGGECEGDLLGDRWAFVDDMISSGATFRRVLKRIGYRDQFAGAFLYVGGDYEASMWLDGADLLTRYAE